MKRWYQSSIWIAVMGGALLLACGDRLAFGQPGGSADSGQGNKQKPAEGKQPPRTVGQPVSAKTAKPKSDGTVTLKGPDGREIRIPNEKTLQEFLEWIRTGKGQQYAVNSVELTGTITKNRAELTAILTVQITEDKGWVSVPLGLNEADLRSKKYEFLGEQPGGKPIKSDKGQESFASLTRDAGYQWWFKGKGYHRLTLTLLVPLTKQNPNSRLKLTIPRRTAASELKLRVPITHKQLSVTREKGTPPKTRSLGRGTSEIQLFGLGQQLDLQWRELPSERKVETLLRTETYLLLKLTEESIVLTGEQRIQALRGSFSKVSVQLPAGFKFVSVEGKYYENHSIDEKTNRITVELSEPRTDLTKLLWKLHRKFPPNGGRFAIEGFQIDRARYQSGEIALQQIQGFQFTKRDNESRLVDRIRVSSFRARELLGGEVISNAYSILQQPFRLDLSASRIAPQVSVEPRMTLRFSEKQVELIGEFRLKVSDDGGTVQELEIDWPDRLIEKWSNISLESPGLVETVTIDAKNANLPIRVRFLKPRTGEFVLPLRASRTIKADGKPLAISLPSIAETTSLPTTLVVHRSTQLEVNLSARNETVLVESEPTIPTETLREFQIQPDQSQTLSAAVTAHEREIRTETFLNATIKGDILQVTQRIRYDVAYATLPEVRLSFPKSLTGRAIIHDSRGTLLMPLDAGLTVGDQQELTFKSPNPQPGLAEFIIEFDVPIKSNSEIGPNSKLLVPLIRSTEAEYSQLRFSLTESDSYSANIPDSSWRPVRSEDTSKTWQSENFNGAIPVELSKTSTPHSTEFTIDRALINAAIDLQGRVRSRAQYRIETNPTTIVLLFPKEIAADAFWWGRTKLTPERQESPQGETITYRLSIPQATENQARLLTVEYHSESASSFRWRGKHNVLAPRFPENVWVEKTVWRITLPDNYHLFSDPRGFTPRFEWKRGFLFWSRQPISTVEGSSQWISADQGPAARDEFSQGNSYQFSRFGPGDSLKFESMNRSLIVLFGAGIAWVIGILMVKLPIMRSVVAMLSAALVMAVLGLWYLVQVQVLLQSAILGLVLAGLLVWIERRMKRTQTDSAVLTISRPSDFFNPTGALPQEAMQPVPVTGSDDVTALRPASHLQESHSASDVKSHP
jgi:hypothetical protein